MATDTSTDNATRASPATLCQHLDECSGPPADARSNLESDPQQRPFDVRLVLDEALGPTDALIACRSCGQQYLIEQIDCRGFERLMRVAHVDSSQVEPLLADLARGSCDLTRAGAQVQHLAVAAVPLPWALAVDVRDLRITRRLRLPEGTRLPQGSWRSLPCDGHWFNRLDG